MAKHSDDEVAPLGADLVFPLLALAFAIYFFISISELPWEAKANGVFIGTALVGLVSVQLLRIAIALARGRANLRADALWLPREALSKRIGMIAVTVGFIASIEWLGLTLGLLLGMFASLWVMGVRSPKVLVSVSVAVALVCYLLFIAALDSSFPHGPLENLFSLLVRRA